MPQKRKFVYFGTPEVGKQTLEVLLSHGYTPALVVTSPDAPKGRGLVLTPSPVKAFALLNNLPVLTPEHLDAEAIAAIRATACDYAIAVAYGKLFPQELIDSFSQGVLNVHYSLLPKYRGATPLETALLHGEQETGVTIQRMALAMDAGDIIAQETVPIEPADTARELRPRLITLGTELLVKTLPEYLTGTITPIAQDDARATRARKLKKEDGLLDLTQPPEQNWNKYRAYADTIGTHFFVDGKRVKIAKASYVNGMFAIERVIPEGKNEMTYSDFKNRNGTSP